MAGKIPPIGTILTGRELNRLMKNNVHFIGASRVPLRWPSYWGRLGSLWTPYPAHEPAKLAAFEYAIGGRRG